MKLRRIFLSVALVALFAACGGKTETATETAVEATPTTEVEAVVEEEVVEAPVAETKAAPQQQQAPKADPCEAKVKAFEKYVDELKAAQADKAKGAKEMKAFADLLGKAAAEEAAVKECVENADYKTRVQNAIMTCKKIRTQK